MKVTLRKPITRIQALLWLIIWATFVMGLSVPAFAQAPAGSAADDKANTEETAWAEVNGLETASLEAFLKEFPNGQHAQEATRALALQQDFNKAAARNTVAAYRSFLALFNSDPAETLSSHPHAPLSKLYWTARGKIEKLVISQINRGGAGQRFAIKEFQPRDDSYTGTITVIGGEPSGYGTLTTLYPEDALRSGPLGVGGFSMSPPRGNRSIIRFIGKVPLGGGITVEGDAKEPLSFFLLKPNGAVYLDGRGTVVIGGKPVSLPIPVAPQSKK